MKDTWYTYWEAVMNFVNVLVDSFVMQRIMEVVMPGIFYNSTTKHAKCKIPPSEKNMKVSVKCNNTYRIIGFICIGTSVNDLWQKHKLLTRETAISYENCCTFEKNTIL